MRSGERFRTSGPLVFIQIFLSFYEWQLKQQICYILHCYFFFKSMVLNRFKLRSKCFFPQIQQAPCPIFRKVANSLKPLCLDCLITRHGIKLYRQAGYHWNLKAFILVEASAKKLIFYFLETDKLIKGIHPSLMIKTNVTKKN